MSEKYLLNANLAITWPGSYQFFESLMNLTLTYNEGIWDITKKTTEIDFAVCKSGVSP